MMLQIVSGSSAELNTTPLASFGGNGATSTVATSIGGSPAAAARSSDDACHARADAAQQLCHRRPCRAGVQNPHPTGRHDERAVQGTRLDGVRYRINVGIQAQVECSRVRGDSPATSS